MLHHLFGVFFFFLMIRRPPRSTRTDTLFPYTTLFRSADRLSTVFNISAREPDGRQPDAAARRPDCRKDCVADQRPREADRASHCGGRAGAGRTLERDPVGGALRHKPRDRKSGVEGKGVSVRVALGGRREIKNKK